MNVIIIGGDETVYFLTKQFLKRDYEVTIVHADRLRSQELADRTEATVVFGDGSDIDILRQCGAHSADVLVSMTAKDQDNLIACQVAQDQFGIPQVIAIVNDPDNKDVFRQLGVKMVFSPTEIIGTIIDQETAFTDITGLLPLAEGRLQFTDVRIDEHSLAIGKSLTKLPLAAGALIIGVIRGDEVFVPHGSTEIQAGDHLLVISDTEHQEQNLTILCSKDNASNSLFA